MRIALISFYSSRRFDEYPVKHSLGAMRLAAFLRARHPDWQVRLRAFDEDSWVPAASASALLSENFDAVGLPAYIWTNRLSRELSELLAIPAGPMVIVGGPETRAMDHGDWPSGVVFVMGQGEEPLTWLCEQRAGMPAFDGHALADNLPLPIYSSVRKRAGAYRYAIPDRDDKRLPHGIELFSTPFDELLTGDRSDTDFAWYETARGCVYDCSFCGHNTLPFFATFDMDHVRAEIVNMRDRGIRRIFLIDPILGGRPARGKAIMRLFQELAPGIAITAYMRPEFLDDEFVEILVESNIHELLMGLQTTNANVPKHVRANHFDKIMKYVPHLAARGIPWRAELIVGLPGDEFEGLRESLRFTIEELRPWSVHTYRLTAIPETKLFELLDRTDEDVWIKANDKLQVVSANSYDERQLRDMLVYAGAVTSLHACLRDRGAAQPSYGDIEGRVRRILADPAEKKRARTAFIQMSHDLGRKIWESYEPVSPLIGHAVRQS